ncbi:histone-lysine N-methyltransferase ASHR1 isoform X2 [Salvia miltiorrhiza]|uniref:histone-lysine N-methyltransferase ASHR1 isoform X2 n=1 Tax=Salvia miltiorrhiza TaxID=226208 RepID=UPI0025AB7FE6|nr:histone-lysine N-methyltransferase ASHR1 isoform X2 [Salvia miltiorrhiza]
MEELQKALNGKSLSISTLPEKGRCLLAARDFSPGEVILSENPYVSVPNKNKESPLCKCEWCFSSTNLKKCSACHVVWYCSSKCQRSDWKLHSEECRVLSKVDKQRVSSLTPSLRLMVKLCIRRKLEIEKVILTSTTESYKYVEALVSHMSDIDEKQLLLYAQMANLVNLILQWPDSQINVKEIAENFSKLACNAHTICDGELRPLGTGLYPVISIINHSCLPNSVLVFEGRLAVVRAMQHILKGTEVLISYVDIAGSTLTRQKALKEQYYFTCACSRCIKLGQSDDIRESTILEGYRCKDTQCDGFLLRDSDNNGFVCQQCGLLREKEEITNLTKELKSMSEKASELLSSGHKSKAIEAYKMIEGLQLQLYQPFSISRMRNLETLIKIFMELEDWTEALSYCRLTIPTYERVYPRSYPLIGLQYYMCGKFEWLLGETEAAVRSLTKALDVLRVTHGTKSPFMVELASKVEEARAEALYKLHPRLED